MKLNDQIFYTTAKAKTKLSEFWKFCKNLCTSKKPKADDNKIEKLREEFNLNSQKMKKEIQLHKEFIEHIPLIIPLMNWIEEQSSDSRQV